MWTRALACVVVLATLAVAFGSTRATPDPPPGPSLAPVNVFDPQPPGAAHGHLHAVLNEVRFDHTPVGQAFDRLRDQAGLNLLVDWTALEAAGVDRAAPVSLRLANVTAAEALAAVCVLAGTPTANLEFEPRGNLVFLATGEAMDHKTVVRVYDVSDLILLERQRHSALRRPPQPATRPNGVEPGVHAGGSGVPADDDAALDTDVIVDDVVRVLQDTIRPDSWRDAGGSVGTVRVLSGRLIVTHTDMTQRRVEALLNALRQAGVPRTPAAPPATRPAAAAGR